MKVMFRRLCRLEERMAPKPAAASERTAELIRDRRRRRVEAAGQPYEELPWHTVALPPGRLLFDCGDAANRKETGAAAEPGHRGSREIAADISP
jgi:hypothetical protein